MAQRLPIPGQDNGTWGDILNGFLEVSLNSDGTLSPAAVANALPNPIATTNLGSGTASSSTYLRGDGTWSIPPSASNATTATPGLLQLAGDLGGISSSATAPTLAATTNVEGIISANTTVAGALQKTNNLSDVNDSGSSRANIHIPALTPAAAVSVSTTTLTTPGASCDGYSFSSGDLFLLTAQNTASQNGLYIWTGASSLLTRPTEFASGLTIKGRTIEIQNGTIYGGTTWVLTTATAGVVVDTGAQNWTNPGITTQNLSTASTIRATTGVPSFLSTDQNGDFAIDTVARVIYGPAASSAWPAGYYYGGNDNGAADYGYVGLTMRPEAAQGFVGGGSGDIWLTRFTAVGVGPVNHIDYYVLVAGSGLTSNECFLGIYDTGQANAGEITLLGQSVDQSTVGTGTGMLTANLTAPLSLTSGNDYYIAVMFNGSTIPTQAGSGSSQTVEFNNPAAVNRMAWQTGSRGGPNSLLPSTLSDIAYGNNSAYFLLGVRA